MGAILGLGIGALAGAVNNAQQDRREDRSNRNQRDMMDINQRNQMELNRQGQRLQLDTWNKTNYGAQMKHLKDAGLNAGLMYGQSGGGGSTTGSQSGGSAASGQAAAPQQGEIAKMMDVGLMKSQIELQQTQAEKNKAEADSIRGEAGTTGEAQIGKIIAETTNENYKINVMKAEKWLKEAQTTGETSRANLSEEQRFDMQEKRKPMIENMQKDLIVKGIEIQAKESGIEMNDARINEVWHKIRQEWTKAGFKGLESIIGRSIKKR